MKALTTKLLALAFISGAATAFATQVLNVNFYKTGSPGNDELSGLAIGADNCTRVPNKFWTNIQPTSGQQAFSANSVLDNSGNSWPVSVSGNKGNQAQKTDGFFSKPNIGAIGQGIILYNNSGNCKRIDFTLSNIPYSKYDLVLYLGSWNDDLFNFGAIQVGDQFYAPDTNNVFCSRVVTSNVTWGVSKGPGVARNLYSFGNNVICIDGLTTNNPVVTISNHSDMSKLAGVLGFQVVNRGALIVPSAGFTFTGNTELDCEVTGSSTLTVTNCTLDLRCATITNFTGKIATVDEGKVILKSGMETTSLFDANSSTSVVIQLTAQQELYGYTAQVAEGVAVSFIGSTGAPITAGVNGKTYTPPAETFCVWQDGKWTNNIVPQAGSNMIIHVDGNKTLQNTVTNFPFETKFGTVCIKGTGTLWVDRDGQSNKLCCTRLILDGAGLSTTGDRFSSNECDVEGVNGNEIFEISASQNHYEKRMHVRNCHLVVNGSGSNNMTITADGYELDNVTVTLKGAVLKLGANKPGTNVVEEAKIRNVTFIYVDANNDGTADGALASHNKITSETMTTFIVPTNNTGKAVVGKAFEANSLVGSGGIIKRGGGDLRIGVKKYSNELNAYTGATMIEEGAIRFCANASPTLTGQIAGPGKLILQSGELYVDGYNTYSGGTEVIAGGSSGLRMKKAMALGTGLVNVTTNGKVVVDGCVLGARVTGPGMLTVANTDPKDTIKFAGAGAIVPSRTTVLNVYGHLDNSVKFDVAELIAESKHAFDLFKFHQPTGWNCPEKFTGAHFVGGEFPSGWKVTPAIGSYTGRALAPNGFYIFLR